MYAVPVSYIYRCIFNLTALIVRVSIIRCNCWIDKKDIPGIEQQAELHHTTIRIRGWKLNEIIREWKLDRTRGCRELQLLANNINTFSSHTLSNVHLKYTNGLRYLIFTFRGNTVTDIYIYIYIYKSICATNNA